jgi:hypothetical protein
MTENGMRERQKVIEERLRSDMSNTLHSHDVPWLTVDGGLLDDLVGDAMHQVDLLLRETT